MHVADYDHLPVQAQVCSAVPRPLQLLISQAHIPSGFENLDLTVQMPFIRNTHQQ
jgi:hypothetical protein